MHVFLVRVRQDQGSARRRRGTRPEGGMNVLEAMQQGVTGAGVRLVIVDDGLEYNNSDIAHAYVSDSSFLYR